MPEWISILGLWIWRAALSASVLVLLIAVFLKLTRTRPATRHSLWLLALAWFALAPIMPAPPFAWSLPSVSRLAVAPKYEGGFRQPSYSAPTPPRTDARVNFRPSNLLAQTADEGGHRSQYSPEFWMYGGDGLVDASDLLFTSDVPPSVDLAELVAPPEVASPPLLTEVIAPKSSSAIDTISRVFAPVGRIIRSRATSIWLVGFGILFLARAVSCLRFRIAIKPVGGGSPDLNDVVARAAEDVGLSRPPKSLLVSNRISPMICCIGPRRLLIPQALWADLNDAGRRAILYHELAHLRRKDHWVRWGQMLLGAIYWWNPIIWWLTKNISEEAENCCDLWVTSLMPNGRRSYAEALLQTSKFINGGESREPALGIGVTRVRARKFARRLTMVMTENARPRLSTPGAVLVALLAIAGWFAAPAWSQSSPKAPTPPSTPTVAELPSPPDTPPPPPEADEDEGDGASSGGLGELLQNVIALNLDSFTDNDADDDDDHDADDDDDGDNAALNKRLERLERRIEELNARMGGGPALSAPSWTLRPGTAVAPVARSMGGGGSMGGGAQETRTYHDSKRKAEDLYSFMSREDVPVKVSGGSGDSITVIGTPAQHRTFEAFLRMIDPDGRASSNVSLPRIARAARVPGQPAMPRTAVRAVPGEVWQTEAIKERVNQQVERAMRDKDRLLEQAARLREKAEKLRMKADAARDDVKGEILEQAEQIRRQAEEMAAQARDLARMHEEAAHADHEKMMMHEKQTLKQELKEKQAAKLAMKRRHSDSDDEDDDDGDSKAGDSNAYAKGYELHMKGKYREAIELFQKSAAANQNTGASLYNIACGYARLGEKDKAFDYLKKAWAAGYRDRNHMKEDEDLNSLHGDKRFKEIVGGEED